MLLPIKPICEAKDARKDGTSIIFIQYCYGANKRVLLNTKIPIPPKYWNEANLSILKDLPPQYGNVEELNESLTKMLRSVEDLVTIANKQGIVDKGSFVRKLFSPGMSINDMSASLAVEVQKTETSELDVYTQIDDYILSRKKKVSKATISILNILKEHLKAFQVHRGAQITFSSFDYSFYESFIDFLTFDYVQPRKKEIVYGLKINTIGKTIKKLRAFIKDRVKRKIVAPIDLTDFKIPEEETDAIYLTYNEINKLYNTDLSNQPFLAEYRDLFVLACLTGLRFSDFSTLRPEDLRNNMLYKKQEKSEHWVVIPLRAEAKKIFTKQFQDKIPQLTNTEFNRHIKTIGKLAGISTLITFSYKKGNKTIAETKEKCDWITTHTARRSFCTNEFLAGTPVKLIMKISGHKREQDFYRYIRISPEEAAIKIQALWDKRDELQAFPLSKSA